jgi:hypothetical protein
MILIKSLKPIENRKTVQENKHHEDCIFHEQGSEYIASDFEQLEKYPDVGPTTISSLSDTYNCRISTE